ncbi:hypothetical protein niasHT_027961 [Heterodera trifolii]|uniref:Uncharacterized protein n=1 Tax=Heterodera trifolii TaxID=157864 RepID=A0ABD2KE44_9BILA
MEKRLNPSALPSLMLSDFGGYSVETLCTLGKEFVLELMTRMFSIVSTLKMDIKGDNKKDLDIVRIQLDYSRLIFLCLTEVRLRIDLKLAEGIGENQNLKDVRPSDERLLELLSEPNQPEENAKKANLAERFEQNRKEYPNECILSYGSIAVSDPLDAFVCCRFSIHERQENICAFGTEYGGVVICDVTAPIKGEDFIKHRFATGKNAVFDLCFIPDRPNLLLSLCGASKLELLDIERSSSVFLLGHRDTIRCASVWPENPFCVLTGSRDGDILLWDLREKRLKREIGRKSVSNSVSSIRRYQTAHEASISITGLLHMSENYFISSSSSSSSGIRIWDLRYQIASSPIRSLFVPQKMSKESGVASMCWDRFRSSFFALCTDNAIYEYVPSLNSSFPVRSLRTKFVNSFFVQCAASPFSDHLLCGSSFSKAFIWDLQEDRKYFQDISSHYGKNRAHKRNKKILPNAKFVLDGHDKEVECVQWSSKGKYLITMDSEIVRIWSPWTGRTENGYAEQVLLNHCPVKFTYPKMYTDLEDERPSSSQTLSQRTFGSENRTDNESRCSNDNDIQLLVEHSPTRSVFNALDNLPSLYAKTMEEISKTEMTQMANRQPKRLIVIKSNLSTTPASKIPRVGGHDHFTPSQHKTPKRKRRNLTAEFKSCGNTKRKKYCVDATSPLGRPRSASTSGGSKSRKNVQLVKPTNTKKILDYFERVQNAASSSSFQ